ncbi:hypothetical protein EMCRGX_G029471 [Ephydatia muelleri]
MLLSRRVLQTWAARVLARNSSSAVPLTSAHYPVKRHDFARVSELDLQEFRSILGDRVITNASELEPYNTDWLRNLRGQSTVALRPKTTDEVSRILAHCSKNRIAVVPQGGNTGLVGGSNPVFDEVVLSLSLMNEVISVDEVAGTLVCQSGCVLESLDAMLAKKGLMMPLDLGAKGSCQVGGNVSTNAGGLRLMRYGSLHGSILGIEVVLPDGKVLDLLSTLRKDNTGYDLKQLFIGAEGTLGVVTAISILTPPRPKAVNVAFMGCSSFEAVWQTYLTAKTFLGEILSAVEFMDAASMQLVEKHLALCNPISPQPFYALVETSGSSDAHDKMKLDTFFEYIMKENLINDGSIATDYTKLRNMWALRERITEALTREGVTYKYDVSLPMAVMYDLVVETRQRCLPLAKCTVGYGHIGDGNLHLNIVGETHSKKLLHLIEPFVFEWTARHRGSISAEHGLGFKKADYIYYSKSKEAVDVMKSLKQLFDPQGILNPYKTLPQQ